MNLQKGFRLGPYEIDSRLGAGGMGEVYRARDVRLARTVAIKILPPEFAANAKLRIRFEREARAISSLTDPHICALYDVGRENGLDYLVMEYCDGPTLAGRLASGRLEPEQALRFGLQIAGALEKAHSSGVIHRDVKPSNIMITRSGVKLLDFGLAAAPWAEESGSKDTTLDRVTEEGHILGTVMYMAPEVLRGSPADERSDVFALGLVLYEMITGRRAFQATDRASLIAQILEQQPVSVVALTAGAPPSLDRLLRNCLTKDPDQRTQSAHDVKLQLQWILENSGSTTEPATRPRGPRGSTWAMVTAVVVVTTAAFVLWWTLARRAEPPAPSSHTVSRTVIDLRDAPPVGLGMFVPRLGYLSPLLALSHDGNLLVYVGVIEGQTQLFLRRMDSVAVEPIPDTRGAHHAFFSPDDRWIGFLAGDRVLKVPVAGGSPIPLAEVTEPIRAVWTSGGIYVIAAMGIGLRLVPENGGAAKKVLDIGPFLSDVLPDGRHALARGFAKFSGDFDQVLLLDLASGARKTLIERGYDARYVSPGFLTFARGGDLHLIRFDVAKLETAGEPIVLQRNVAMESFFGQAQYSASSSGTLAFLPGDDRSIGKLAWVDRDGRTEFLPLPPRLYGVFSLSPDGKRLAVEISDVTNSIAVIDLERQETRFLRIDGDVRRPEWTDDGRLVFSISHPEQSPLRIVSTDTDGGEMKTLLAEPNVSYMHIANSPDGATIVAHRAVAGAGPGVNVVLRGSKSPPIPLEGGGTASISPDSRWIAYVTRSRGRQIVVAPLADPRRAQQISADGGGEPLWCRRCPDLFYRNGARWYAVRVSAGETLQWDSPRLVWETKFIDTQGRSFDVSPDGTRLLVSKRVTPDITDRIQLIQNWPSLLPQH